MKDLLLIPHNEDFEEKCMGAWCDEDFNLLVYSKEVTEHRKKMRDFFKRNKPSNSFIRDLILDKQYTAVEIIASYYEFNEELQRNVLNKDMWMRKAYTKHHQFLRMLEQKFIRKAEKSEAQSYYSKYFKTMDKAALNDCHNIKKLNMGCISLTLSKRQAEKQKKEKKGGLFDN